MGGGGFLVIVLIIAAMLPAGLNALPNYPLDGVDLCIFACDRCFKGQSLVNCANNCIDTGGDAAGVWRITCPFFEDGPEVQQL